MEAWAVTLMNSTGNGSNLSFWQWALHEPSGRHRWIFPVGPAILLLAIWLIVEWPPTDVLLVCLGVTVLDTIVSYWWWVKDTRRAAGRPSDE